MPIGSQLACLTYEDHDMAAHSLGKASDSMSIN